MRHLARSLNPIDPEVASTQNEERLNAENWRTYLTERFPQYLQDSHGRAIAFADFHIEFWNWVWTIRRGQRSDPFVAVWSRGAAKSTSVELAIVALGERDVRRYALYVSSTQDRADDHVRTIGSMLESVNLQMRAPKMAERSVSKYGTSRGWRRNRLRTATGYTTDAMGLDTAARGVKLEQQRPDLIIFDDIDSEFDTEKSIQKKIRTITKAIIPAGSDDLAIIGVQNLLHSNSIFTRFVDGRADFLSRRRISGPHPAIKNFTWEKRDDHVIITGGTPTWEGLNLEICQNKIEDMGIVAFLTEHQHEAVASEGTIIGDVWRESAHVINAFRIPATWYVDRSFDYGYSKPFSVGWWAQSDGSPAPNGRTYPRGTLFRIHEWYGWNGKPNVGCRMQSGVIAKKILEIEDRIGLKGRVYPGPADSQIWDGTDGHVIATDMAAEKCNWLVADKRPGSRVNGAILVRKRLEAASKTPIEGPGLFIFRHCVHWIRCVPHLPRDPADPDDAWTEGEDHNWDETRYRVQQVFRQSEGTSTVGMY